MDSLSQIVLGASVAGLIAGKRCTPKVLVAGAVLGTLPDLDVFIEYDDPIMDMIKHRGFSHSVFVLLPLSFFLSLLFKRVFASAWPFWQLFLLISMALVTHPILDTFTSYGTQFFWPIKMQPLAFSSIFIIDPLYTLPLLFFLIAALIWRNKAARLCGMGLGLSSLYLLWSLFSLGQIKDRLEENMPKSASKEHQIYVAPTPFNTFLWRIVLLNEHEYLEGLASLLDDDPKIDWVSLERGNWPLLTQSKIIEDFDYFTGGFLRFTQEKDELIATDLRLGMAIYHPFRFVVAKKDAKEEWVLVLPERRKENAILPKHIPAFWLRLLGTQSIDAQLNHPAPLMTGK